jgi:two-component system, LytTR family, response regulator
MILKCKIGKKFVEFNSDDILFIQAANIYSWVYTKDGRRILCSKPLNSVLELLPEKDFFQTHRSYVVNLREIYKIDTMNNQIYLKDGQTDLPLSRYRKQLFQKELVKNSKTYSKSLV